MHHKFTLKNNNKLEDGKKENKLRCMYTVIINVTVVALAKTDQIVHAQLALFSFSDVASLADIKVLADIKASCFPLQNFLSKNIPSLAK